MKLDMVKTASKVNDFFHDDLIEYLANAGMHMQVVDDQLVFQDQLSKKWLAVPLVKLISASTNSGMYWINVFNEDNAICTVFVDKETYQYVNMCTTPSIVFWEQNNDK